MSSLIVDLAYILVVASVVTIIFKRLKQPLVLGYIVAGFLAGPHMPYTPSVSSMDGIDEWSELGVIFLMFTLGLEFSFKKILKMGMQPILTAIMIMCCMIGVGGMIASLFGWSNMDRLFLGGMMLSALAVSRTFQGTELIKSLLQLAFFLMLWFLVGIYLLPIILRKAKNYINSETLLVVSVGLCFLLAVIATKVGYSPAFGAFMMGSILAETLEAENIEKSVSSLRDLFGAVFIKLKFGAFGAEPWTENMRKELEAKLHIKAYDIYGLTEVSGPGVGGECEYQRNRRKVRFLVGADRSVCLYHCWLGTRVGSDQPVPLSGCCGCEYHYDLPDALCHKTLSEGCQSHRKFLERPDTVAHQSWQSAFDKQESRACQAFKRYSLEAFFVCDSVSNCCLSHDKYCAYPV